MANILHCRPRNILHNRAIIRKLFIKIRPDKLTPSISIIGKHAAHCIYSFLARLKDPRHNLNIPRLYPCIITGFSTNNMQLPTRTCPLFRWFTTPAGKVSSWRYCRTALLSRRLGTIPRKGEIYLKSKSSSSHRPILSLMFPTTLSFAPNKMAKIQLATLCQTVTPRMLMKTLQIATLLLKATRNKRHCQ